MRTSRAAALAIVAYQGLLLAALFLRPDIDPARKPISEYAIGRHGWVTVLAFLTAAVSYASLFVALGPVVNGTAGRIGRLLLAVCAAGTVGVGVFIADPVTTPFPELSPIGTLHVVCGLTAMVLLPVAALLINRDLARSGRDGAAILRRTAWLPLAGFVAHLALSAVIPPEGWPPRLLFLTYALWLLGVAWWVRRALPTAQRQRRILTKTGSAGYGRDRK